MGRYGWLAVGMTLWLGGCGDPSPSFVWGRAPSWSPDGQRIVFSQHINTPTDQFPQFFTRIESGFVWTIGPDGSSPIRLSVEGNDLDPDWAPDNTRLVFVSLVRGNPDIWVMNADGSGRVRLTDARAMDVEPAWSPDGTRIAFASNRAGQWDIWVMNADGSNLHPVTLRPADDTSPDWSPDGKQLVFASNADRGNWDLWVVNADGSGLRQLTSKPEENSRRVDGSPAWSPDGTRIAYASWEGDWDIWVIQVDGSHPVNLTRDPAHDGEPAWSPDGQRIVFTSGRTEWWHLYIMNADGSNVRQLTGQGE